MENLEVKYETCISSERELKSFLWNVLLINVNYFLYTVSICIIVSNNNNMIKIIIINRSQKLIIMKKTIAISLASALIIGLMSFGVVSSNGITGRTTTGCSCHSPSANTGVIVSLTSPNSTLFSAGYIASTTYTLNLTVAETGQTLFGIDVKASSGVLAAGTDGQTVKSGTEITHTGAGNATTNTHTFSFKWVAPASGAVTFTFAGNATNGNGVDDAGDHWNKGSVAVSPSTGISEKEIVNMNISVFPNPVSESATISYQLPSNALVSATLININGQIIATLFDNEEQIAGIQNKKVILNPSIAKGVYFVALYVNGSNSFKKIILE